MIEETLPAALDGERLDRVVAMIGGGSRSEAARLVDAGAVEVGGEVVTQRSFRVVAGMTIRFEPTEPVSTVPVADPNVAFDVLYADADVVVVDKPAGLVVHPGAGNPGRTLVNGLLVPFPELVEVGQPGRPGIVHRLDGDTSGVLVVARTPSAYTSLVGALARREVRRVYAAAVVGHVADDRGTIDAPIGRSARQRTRMAIVADGREARTHYEVLERSSEDAASWLRCELETGRTHQIRVHLAAIDHPVLGDRTYGPRTGSPLISRVALHALRLEFEHPTTGDVLGFDSPLPADLIALRRSLGFDTEPS